MPWTLAKCVATGHNNSMNVTIALKRSRVAVWLFLSAALAAGPLSAGVVVVQNWTSVKIAFAASGGDGQATRYTVAPSDIAAIPADGPVAITVGEGAAAVPQQVPINSIIYFVVKDGILHFQRLVLPGVEDKSDGGAKQTATVQPPAAGPKPKSEPAPIYKIPVAILVDTADVALAGQLGKEAPQAPGRLLRHLRASLPRALRGRLDRRMAIELSGPLLR